MTFIFKCFILLLIINENKINIITIERKIFFRQIIENQKTFSNL